MEIGSTPNKPRGGADPGRAGRQRPIAVKTVAGAAWVGAAALAIALFALSLPAVYGDLATTCAGPSCADGRLTPEGARELRDLGVSLRAYAFYGVDLAAFGVQEAQVAVSIAEVDAHGDVESGRHGLILLERGSTSRSHDTPPHNPDEGPMPDLLIPSLEPSPNT